jgi:hypothetical protein
MYEFLPNWHICEWKIRDKEGGQKACHEETIEKSILNKVGMELKK